jgi:hypothetical protein
MPNVQQMIDNLQLNLRMSQGGGLRSRRTNARLGDTPCLIVGLGGTGVDAVIRIKHFVNERMGYSATNPMPSNIAYLVFDTDSSGQAYKGTEFSDDEKFVMQGVALAATYDNIKNNGAHPHIASWLRHDLAPKNILDGAGGTRQIGRMLLFQKLADIIPALTNKLTYVIGGTPVATPVEVYICAGISGGTGSGSFIDIPYIIRGLAATLQRTVQIVGFLFLPDVNLQAIDSKNTSVMAYVKRNGFAAMKELDYLMNLGASGNGERFRQHYSAGLAVDTEEAPYNLCHLVSSLNKDGVLNIGQEDCMISVAEAVINFISDDIPPQAAAGAHFTLDSYMANVAATREAYVASLDGVTKKCYPINYEYCAIGASSGILPLDNVLDYLTHTMFQQMAAIYNAAPATDDVKGYIDQLGLGEGVFRSNIERGVALKPTEHIEYDIIKSHPSHLEDHYDAMLDSLETILKANVEKTVQDAIASLEGAPGSPGLFSRIFADRQKGPYYLNRLIFQATNQVAPNSCLSAFMEDQINNVLVKEFVNGADLDLQLKISQQLRDDIATNRALFLGFGKKSAMEKYRKAMRQFEEKRLKNLKTKYVRDAYNQINQYIMNKNNQVWSVYTTLINTLQGIFDDNSQIRAGTGIAQDGNVTTFSWDIIDSDVLVQQVALLNDGNGALAINFDASVQAFLNNLIDKSREWIDCDMLVMARLMNDFALDSFQAIVAQSMEYYLRIIYTTDNDFGKALAKILSNLSKRSQTLFLAGSSFRGEDFAPYKFMSVPHDAISLANTAIGNAIVNQVKYSVITNRVFMLQSEVAVPMAAYSKLNECEVEYEKFYRNSSSGKGMHLYEGGIGGTNANWRELPSPNHELCWDSAHKIVRTSKENDDDRALFHRALALDYIKWDGGKNAYVGYYGIPVDIQQILKANGIDDINALIAVASAIAAEKTLQSALGDKGRLTEQLKFYSTFVDPNTNEPLMEFSEGVFINMPLLKKEIRRMVENHEETQRAIDILHDAFTRALQLCGNFARALYTGTIYKAARGAEWHYRDAEGVARRLESFEGGEHPDDCKEYYLYEAFRKLPDDTRELIAEAAKSVRDSASDAQYDALKNAADEWIKTLCDKRGELGKNHAAVHDGIKKHGIYRELASILKNERANM